MARVRKLQTPEVVPPPPEPPARPWSDYPLGTKAHAIMGGHWIKVERGWKWHCGSTFPTPGADVSRIELPGGSKDDELDH